ALAVESAVSAGDLVVFTNTAGYQMDSNESSFHQIPLPRKIAAVRRSSAWTILADEIPSQRKTPR
ncbi:hypothetical protein EOA29_37410, partial [Mesorhizobium sp. M1E.F.Ca.ET.063.01.1.1]